MIYTTGNERTTVGFFGVTDLGPGQCVSRPLQQLNKDHRNHILADTQEHICMANKIMKEKTPPQHFQVYF